MSTRPLVSVIIPTYNRRDSLARTLRSLAEQDYGAASIEVIVADTGSTDGTREMAAGFPSGLRVRHLPLQKKFLSDAPVARNAAAAIASGEILVFVDSDIVVPRHFISEHVFCHRSVAHAFVGGTVCHVFGMSMEQTDGDNIAGEHVQGMIAPYQAGMLEFSGNPASCRFPWSYCYGANYSLAKADLITKGLWVDEQFAEKGVEACDTELSYRAHLLGQRIVFSRYAVAYHDLGTVPTFDSQERTRRVIKGLEFIGEKHPSSESKAYADFRLQDCENFLEKLLYASKARTFPLLQQPEWLAWMERILGTPAPALTILLFSTGDAGRLEKALGALQQQTCAHEAFEVLVCDASAGAGIRAARNSHALDLMVQKASVDYCLRYYPAGNGSAFENFGFGLRGSFASSRQFSRNLSRVGWYFSGLNSHGLLGRIRGERLGLLDDNEEISRDYVTECLKEAGSEHEMELAHAAPVSILSGKRKVIHEK
jgi:GT2 family glycosyltransferase